MSRPAPLPDPLIDRQLAMLTRLAEIGMEIAEAAGRRAAEGGGTDGADPGLSYARAARAVRLTLALQSRLAKDRLALDREETKARAAEAARRRGRIHRRVEQALGTGLHDEDEIEQLSSAVWESLTDADDDDLAGRPVDEVVARICRDLGLAAASCSCHPGRPEGAIRDPGPPHDPVPWVPAFAGMTGERAARAVSAPPAPAAAAGRPPRPGSSCSAAPG